MNIANLPIAHRLTISFALTTAMLALVVIIGASQLFAVSDAFEAAVRPGAGSAEVPAANRAASETAHLAGKGMIALGVIGAVLSSLTALYISRGIVLPIRRAVTAARSVAAGASEVRSLAQRSAAAAKEIKALIGDSVGQVGEGARLAGEAGRTMERIVESVDRVTGIMGGIRATSVEQLSGIEQVNAAIARMDHATRQNAAMVEQAAAAAAAMQQQASGLAALVGVFKLDRAAGHRGGHPRTVQQALPVGMY